MLVKEAEAKTTGEHVQPTCRLDQGSTVFHQEIFRGAGPTQLLIMINDLPIVVTDDVKLYTDVERPENSAWLQNDPYNSNTRTIIRV